MAQDVGIIISQPGVNVAGAPTSQISLNTSNPFIKLDTQNSKAFQNILLLITTNPTEPTAPPFVTYTIVHQFAHGYKYIPSLETLFFVSTPPPATGAFQTYFQDRGIIGEQTPAIIATLYAVADATNAYFIVQKTTDGSGPVNLLTGTVVQIGVHVFLEDVGV